MKKKTEEKDQSACCLLGYNYIWKLCLGGVYIWQILF